VRLLTVQDRVEPGQFPVTAGERRDRRRQLRGDRYRRWLRAGRPQAHRRGAGVQGRVLPQDGGLELAQRRAGRQPELVGQGGAQPLVDGQRVGLPPAAVQRRHQLGVDLLVERVVGGHLLELGYQLPVLPGVQPGLGQRVPDLLAEQVQPFRLLFQPGQPGQVGQWAAAPQSERLAQVGDCAARVGGLCAPAQQPLGLLHVGAVLADVEQVTGRPGDDGGLADHGAQV